MKRKIELLAPGGDTDSIKAAISAGADAVYCGLNKFNARNRAENINFEALYGILHLAHENNCKVFLTLNIILVGSEIPYLFHLLNKLVNTDIDGVIIQDFGLFYLLSTYFKGLEIHASTQLNTHNEGQIRFLSKLTAARVNLPRELNLKEIKALAMAGNKKNVLTEVFVHGSYCISFSGLCYISSVHGGNSGNRGRCSQPCRDRYLTTPEGKNFPLNLKDNSAYFDLKELSDAGVDSLKIEGRIKKFDYVYTVVDCWKKQLGRLYDQNELSRDNKDLYSVFNRDFSNAYLMGHIDKDMFIDNPRDFSVHRFSGINENSENKRLFREKTAYYAQKEKINAAIKTKIDNLSIAKIPLTLIVSGENNTPLKVFVKTPDTSFALLSETSLASKNKKSTAQCLNHTILSERLGPLNDTAYYIKQIDADHLQKDLFLSFKALASVKKRILFTLNGSRESIAPINVPFLKKQKPFNIPPRLCVLISSKTDVYLCHNPSADIFFQLPNSFGKEGAENGCSAFVDLFSKNKKLIPWFPSVLIGENYIAAVKFLEEVRPGCMVVTNNTGIAYEAFKKGIPWIAGPYLNMVNSFSLLCLKEQFNCSGAFISNELSKHQLKSIIAPDRFKLYYSIYHPILLLTSRQCLLQQVTGCEKTAVDDDCLQMCDTSSSITHLKKGPFLIKKTKGNYHSIYNQTHFLNTDIVTDLPGIFSRFSIDLRDIKTETEMTVDKPEIIQLFKNHVQGNPGSKEKLKQVIHPSTMTQYKKGI